MHKTGFSHRRPTGPVVTEIRFVCFCVYLKSFLLKQVQLQLHYREGPVSDTIQHRPQVLYIFGILGSRPPFSFIQITIWALHSPPDGGPPYGLAL